VFQQVYLFHQNAHILLL